MIPDLVIAALQFYRDPRRLAHFSQPGAPLPPGIPEFLSAPFHSLSEDNLPETARALGATEEECRQLVPFFAKQVLLVSGADYYRKLGVSRGADSSQIRQHYQYLIRLFHPDRDVNNENWDELYAPQINEAYSTLRNPAKRAEYDATLPDGDGFDPAALAATGGAGPSASAFRSPRPETISAAGLSPRAKRVALGLALGLVVLFGLLVSIQSNRPTLHVDDELLRQPPASAHSEQARPGELDPGGASPDAAVPWPPSGQGQPADAPPGQRLDREQRRARDIEALVQRRLETATKAVLGADAARRRNRAPAEAATVTATPESGDIPAAEVDAAFSVTERNPAGRQSVEPSVADPPKATVETTAAPVKGLRALTEDDLEQMLDSLSRHYQSGDLEAFVALFSADIVTSDTEGREALREDYQDLFARPRLREMRLGRFDWTDGILAREGSGAMEIITRAADGSDPSSGKLSLIVRIESLEEGVRITRMLYD